MANSAEQEAARIKAGVLDPKALALQAHEKRTLADHLGDWHAHLLAKGGTRKHADLYADRAGRVLAIVAGGTLAEIDPPKASSKAERDRAAKRAETILKGARLSDLNPTRV